MFLKVKVEIYCCSQKINNFFRRVGYILFTFFIIIEIKEFLFIQMGEQLKKSGTYVLLDRELLKQLHMNYITTFEFNSKQ